MSQRTSKIIGWSLAIVLAILFTMSSFLKLTQNEEALTQASAIGFNPITYQIIGAIELISLILFLIPRTSILGTLLLVAYMGGAIVTHLQHQQPILIAVAVQILVWITAFIRFPELKQRLLPIKKL
jgi:hypothetical protein